MIRIKVFDNSYQWMIKNTHANLVIEGNRPLLIAQLQELRNWDSDNTNSILSHGSFDIVYCYW